jgi:peptide-methionine (R)-S-oxide reductase
VLSRAAEYALFSRMKNVVFTTAFAAALAGCGGGDSASAPAAPEPAKPSPSIVTTTEPKQSQRPVQDTGSPAQPKPAAKTVQPVQHEPIMKPTNVAAAKTVKTEAEWRATLTPDEYRILRQKGTERAFTGKFDHHFKDGTYVCKACGTPLFLSETKYNSGCGWPAFYESIDNTVDETRDASLGMVRIEITCKKCNGHLGHIFDDGPNPTGLRYCVNSASMDFVPAEKKPGVAK